MKECWVTEPLHFEMRETEIPEPKDNEVQIKMMAAGVCGSDIHIYKYRCEILICYSDKILCTRSLTNQHVLLVV